MSNLIIITSGEQMERKVASLKEIKVDIETWEIFYLDEAAGEKWVQEYPYSEMQAGGPPQLRLINKFPWE